MSNRKEYLDIMRVLAIILVIFNHLPGYFLYQETSGISQAIYMCLSMITRVNVPLFLMISGALLLGKSESFGEVFKKRISRILIVLVSFSLLTYIVYFLCDILQGKDGQLSIVKFLIGLMQNSLDGTGPYWYLYSYLAFLFMLTFLQRVAKGLNRTEFLVLFSIHFLLSSLIPLANIILSFFTNKSIYITSSLDMPLSTCKAIFYPLIGYYIDHNLDFSKQHAKKNVINLCLLSLVALFLECLCTYWEGTIIGEFTENYVQMFDYILTITIFVIIKYLTTIRNSQRATNNTNPLIYTLGSLTFGIYLFDQILKHLIGTPIMNILRLYLPEMGVDFIWIILSIAFGGTLTFLLKKLAIISKLL